MLDHLPTALAKFIVKHLRRPRPLVIRAWLCLAAEADDREDKRRCLEPVLEEQEKYQMDPRVLLVVLGGST